MNTEDVLKQIEEYEEVVEGKPRKAWHGPAPMQVPDFRSGGLISVGDLNKGMYEMVSMQGPEVVMPRALQDQMAEFEWKLRNIQMEEHDMKIQRIRMGLPAIDVGISFKTGAEQAMYDE